MARPRWEAQGETPFIRPLTRRLEPALRRPTAAWPRARLVLRVLSGLLLAYVLLKALSAAGGWLLWEVLDITPTPLPAERNAVFLTSFLLVFAPVLYLSTCALARRFLRPRVDTLVLYMGTTCLCATLGEVGTDTLCVALLKRPLWLYHVWPVNHGYTSAAGLVTWPLYGGFLYFLHQALRANPRLRPFNGDGAKVLLLAVDAMLLEICLNVFSLGLFQSFFFFYFRGDLQHFSTGEIFVPYVVLGYAGLKLLAFLERRRHRLAMGLALQALGILCVLAMP
ncbi:hypothetical protein ATI61_122114 [Archangium gephyra]|uniref:Uncharacterized protein n=1 Tax=Archangium gephyra TaxID=48 RepID=A0ABX9JLG6_9BACT|nr:hypothetical protein [Archangium gephyra]REG20414.1 hypothetical protein ATI61_122114 [Archangium gephyra]